MKSSTINPATENWTAISLISVMKCEQWTDQHWHERGTKKKMNPFSWDSVDPNSMQDACHTWTQLNDFALYEVS